MARLDARPALRLNRLDAAPPPRAGMRTLAFVCNNSTGLSLFRGSVIRKFIEAGYEVHAVAPHDADTAGLIGCGVRFTELELSQHGMNLSKEFATLRSLKRIYARVRPDLVFHYTIKLNIYGTAVARALGIPCVCIIPGLGSFPDVPNPIIRRLLARGYAYAAQHTSEVWFLNQHDYGFFESRGWLNGVTSRLLPGEGVDTERYALRPLPAAPPTEVLFIGRLLESKGLRVYVEAARLVCARSTDFRFAIIGFLEEHNPAGVSAAELHSWIDEGFVEFRGSTEDVRPYIAAADIIVLPTHFREGLSRVLQEAMSCGRPVITTNVPGAGELVSHGVNGYVVPARDPRAVADTLIYHASQSLAVREAMGRHARRRIVERHDERLVHGHYFDAVGRLLNAAV